MFYISWLPEYCHSMSDSRWHCAGPYMQAVIPLQPHPFLGWTLSSDKTSVLIVQARWMLNFYHEAFALAAPPWPIQSAFLVYLLRSISDSIFWWSSLWLLQPIGISPISPSLWDLLSISHKLRFFVTLAVPTQSAPVHSLIISLPQLNSQVSLSESKSGLESQMDVSSTWDLSTF